MAVAPGLSTSSGVYSSHSSETFNSPSIATDDVILVLIGARQSSSGSWGASSVTVGGVSAAKIGNTATHGSRRPLAEIWGLRQSDVGATGVQSVVVTLGGTASDAGYTCATVVGCDVSSATSWYEAANFDSAAITGTSNSATTSLTTANDGGAIVGVCVTEHGGDSMSATGGTDIQTGSGGSGATWASTYELTATAGAAGWTWNWTTSDQYAYTTIALVPGGGATTNTITTSIGSVLQQSKTLSLLVGSAIQDQKTLTAAVTGAIASGSNIITALNTVARQKKLTNVNVEATIQQVKQITASLNAYLIVPTSGGSVVADISAALRKMQTLTTSVGAALAVEKSILVSADMVAAKQFSVIVSAEALIKKTLQAQTFLNAYLLAAGAATRAVALKPGSSLEGCVTLNTLDGQILSEPLDGTVLND